MDMLAAMQSFVRVYETGSFSAAAKVLRVGQPSVSKVVAQLEDHLGVKLFLRSTRRLTPTEAGQNFYDHALRTMEAADVAVRAVTSDTNSLSGRIRVSGTITFMRQYIIPKLPLFFARHPNVEIDLLLEDRNVGLIEEGIDVALRMGKLANSGLAARKIGQCRRIVVGSGGYFAEHGEPKTPEELVTHPTIILSQGEGGEHITFTRGTKPKDITLRPRLRISATEGIRAAVLAGIGPSIATEWIFEAELQSGAIREVLKDWHLPLLDLWVVLPAGRQASARTRAFVSFVEDQLQQTRFSVRSDRPSS